jgi:hypothetical protein
MTPKPKPQTTVPNNKANKGTFSKDRPGPGRPAGVPNKATKALKDMILGALDRAGGEKYLMEQATKNPGPFLALIGKVLPTTIAGDLTVNVGLAEAIKTARERIALDKKPT